MPTKNPRVHVVLEKPLFSRLKRLAGKRGLSMSLEARELIRNALHLEEKTTSRRYSGKNMSTLIGAYPMGETDPEELLAEQVHG